MEIVELYRSAPRSGRGGRRFKSCHSDQTLTTSMAYGASYGERNPLLDRFISHESCNDLRFSRCATTTSNTSVGPNIAR